MNKQEFLAALQKGLSGLSENDREERLTFYREMIDDRIEEGFSEEEAVAAAGSVEEILAQTAPDLPPASSPAPAPKKKTSAGILLLLILGSPIWFSLLIAAFAVFVSLFAAVWSVVISLWAAFAALAGGAAGSIIAGIAACMTGNGPAGTAAVSAGLVCAGLAIFAFYGCRAATRGTAVLTKNTAAWISHRFLRKETYHA